MQTRTGPNRNARLGDDGANDLLMSELLRKNETQVWFLRNIFATQHPTAHKTRKEI